MRLVNRAVAAFLCALATPAAADTVHVGASNGGTCGLVEYPLTFGRSVSIVALDGTASMMPGSQPIVMWASPAPRTQAQQGAAVVTNDLVSAAVPPGSVVPLHVQFATPVVLPSGNGEIGFNTPTAADGTCPLAAIELTVQYQ